jgi:hypothetical protein
MKAKLQALAMLDSVLMAEHELRYFSFNSRWGPREQMGSMRDGEGSEFFFLFAPYGASGKIYCPDTADTVSRSSLSAHVPHDFASFLAEPAFNLRQISCCLWRRPDEEGWTSVPSNMGAIPLLAFVGDRGLYYSTWAGSYYEIAVPVATVESMFETKPLTREMVSSLNPQRALGAVVTDAEEIGYPLAL